jgi:transcriptional regulator with XRE-family HTH domain
MDRWSSHMNYGNGLTVARTKAGLSKRQLAKKVGVDASYITNIEAGRKKPSLDTMEKLADAVGVPMTVLMLFSSGADDLKGISSEQAAGLGDRLMALLKA